MGDGKAQGRKRCNETAIEQDRLSEQCNSPTTP